MDNNNLLMSGELAKKMGVSVRTLQYYDKQNLLKPSAKSKGGRRLYSSQDVVKLYQILSMKDLGFSLEEIKAMLRTLNTPAQVLEALEKQNLLIGKRIAELEKISGLIDSLQEEVLQIDEVNFEKYANIVGRLKSGSDFYWAPKLFDDALSEHTKERFTDKQGLAMEIIDTYQTLLEEAVLLTKKGEPPQSKSSMCLAKKWWDMIYQFTGGDMSLLTKMMLFNNDKSSWSEKIAKKQKLADIYIGTILIEYFSQSNISEPEMEGKS